MNILFLCVANSARSQMAEGLARHLYRGDVVVQSAGSQPSHVNPLAVQALHERGIDASSHYSKNVANIPLHSVDVVITLCAEEVCPVVTVKTEKIHWPLPDPAAAQGDETDKLASFRWVRDELERRLREFGREKNLLRTH